MSKVDKIKVSVIIPVYNTADYLRQSLDSVLNQSLKEIEVVVVVDASPDESLDIVRNYQQNDGRIVVVNKEINEGLPAARNSGVDVCSGEYIIHLDSDDFWIDGNMLQELYEVAEIDGCDILAFNGYNYEDGKFKSLIANRINMINGRFNEESELWDYRSIFLFIFRKEFIDRNNILFLNGITLGEDGIFVSSALVAAESVSSTAKCYYAYRRNVSSMMNTKWSLDAYLEEETSSQIISNTVSVSKSALNKYLFYRINQYWISKISVRAKRELTKSERFKLYAYARNNFIKLDMNSVDRQNRFFKRARLLHRYFVSSDFNKIDKLIEEVNCLTLSSAFSFGCLLHILKKARVIYLAYLWVLIKIKQFIKDSPLVSINRYFYRDENKPKQFVNIEMLDEYNYCLSNRGQAAGASAMLRVKNEEKRIQSCIDSIIDVFDEVVVIDNASSDSTLEIVLSLMNVEKYAKKIKVFSYPHIVARCGQEHSKTPEDSVHSLAYYYNWSLSKCNYSVVCKWDADMLLSSSRESRARFKKFLDDAAYVNSWVFGEFKVQTIYIDDEGESYIAKDDVNSEVRIFPNSPSIFFKKGVLWEELTSELYMPRRYLTDVCVYEIKDVVDDEYSHWTNASFKGDRKVREYRNYMRVKNNWHKSNSLDFIPSGEL